MTVLSESMDTRERAGLDFAPLAKDAVIAYEGAIIALNVSTNEGEPAADAASLMVIGRNEKYVDNTDGGERLKVRAGVFRWNNSATNPVAAGAKFGYVEDDNTISSDAGDHGVLAPVIDVDDDGVWVDTRRAAVLAVMGSSPVAANVANPGACANMNTDLAGVDTGTDMTAAQAAQIVSDLGALKTAIDGNKAAVDADHAALQGAGLMAGA